MLEKLRSIDARYCGVVALPKSQVVWESPSLTLFAEKAPTPTVTQFAGGPCGACWRRICASASLAKAATAIRTSAVTLFMNTPVMLAGVEPRPVSYHRAAHIITARRLKLTAP